MKSQMKIIVVALTLTLGLCLLFPAAARRRRVGGVRLTL